MAPAKRRAGGAKPAGKAPPHSLVTFAVNQGVDIEHVRAQLNAFAEKYGAMMDTTAREALKHITADGLGPERHTASPPRLFVRSARARARGATATDPRRVRPPPSRQGYHREVPRSRRAPRSRPTLPRLRPDSDSESLASSRGTSVAAPKRPPTDSPRPPAPHPAAPANPPAELLIAESESEPEPDPDPDLSAEELSDAEDEDDEFDSFVEKDDEEEEDDDEDKYVFSQADVADAFGEVIEPTSPTTTTKMTTRCSPPRSDDGDVAASPTTCGAPAIREVSDAARSRG